MRTNLHKAVSHSAHCCLFVLLFSIYFLPAASAQNEQRCLTTRYDSLLRLKYPGLEHNRQQLNEKIRLLHFEQKNNMRIEATPETIIIPVVVHVIHHTASRVVGGPNNSNISDEQILSQIEVLNEDYRRKMGTNGYNDHPAGTDMEIEFRLATVDPGGNPTNGITRTYNAKESFDIDDDDQTLKAISYWPSNRYLNIWVTTLKNRYLGYAQFPVVENIGGLPDIGKLARTDGVVINHANFGRKTGNGTVISNVYGDGRTTTHEVAHWLGLLHTWGDTDCGDDYCADTPNAEGPNNTTNCVELFSSCNGSATRNMTENFLDYSPDKCMNVFTFDQKARIRSVLQLSQSRAELIRRANEVFQSGLASIQLTPNPANGFVKITANYNNISEVNIQVVNLTGKIMKKVLYRLQGNIIEMDIRNLPDGLYIVQVSSAKETRTARMMVLK